jgi:hypothetical protein
MNITQTSILRLRVKLQALVGGKVDVSRTKRGRDQNTHTLLIIL